MSRRPPVIEEVTKGLPHSLPSMMTANPLRGAGAFREGAGEGGEAGSVGRAEGYLDLPGAVGGALLGLRGGDTDVGHASGPVGVDAERRSALCCGHGVAAAALGAGVLHGRGDRQEGGGGRLAAAVPGGGLNHVRARGRAVREGYPGRADHGGRDEAEPGARQPLPASGGPQRAIGQAGQTGSGGITGHRHRVGFSAASPGGWVSRWGAHASPRPADGGRQMVLRRHGVCSIGATRVVPCGSLRHVPPLRGWDRVLRQAPGRVRP